MAVREAIYHIVGGWKPRKLRSPENISGGILEERKGTIYYAGYHPPDALTEYFEKIKDRCEFGKWMFGHYHENRNVGRKFMVVYEQFVRVV